MQEDFTIKKMRDLFQEKLTGIYRPEEVRSLLYILFDHFLNWPKTLLHLEPGKPIPDREYLRLKEALERLLNNEPVQYITGIAWFNGLRFRVAPGVLIPRPETEILVDLAARDPFLKDIAHAVLLDIGTGTGCIADSMKKIFPGMTVWGMDISSDAIHMAAENATANGVPIKFLQSEILDRDHWNKLPRPAVILSNPPYVLQSEIKWMKPNVLGQEPPEALFVADEDPLQFYDAIASFALEYMTRPGIIWLEINERMGEKIRELMTGKGLSDFILYQDMNGKDRFARIFISQA